jgi:hypothetical protein
MLVVGVSIVDFGGRKNATSGAKAGATFDTREATAWHAC